MTEFSKLSITAEYDLFGHLVSQLSIFGLELLKEVIENELKSREAT